MKTKRASYLPYVERLCTSVFLHHKKLVPYPTSLNSFYGRGSMVIIPPSWGCNTSPWGLAITKTANTKKPKCCQQCPNPCSPRRSHFKTKFRIKINAKWRIYEKLVGLRIFSLIGNRCRLNKLCKESKVNPWDHKIIRNCLQTSRQGQGAYLIFTACIVQLCCNNGSYSYPVKNLHKNSEKEKKCSKINSFERMGHLFKENLRKYRYIPLICALSLAGFDTKQHLKLRQRCSLKCHDFTFQSRILQVKKGHLILLSVTLYDVEKFPPPEPSSGSESSFFRGATVFFGHQNAISDSEAWNRQTCGQTVEGNKKKNQRWNVGLMLH